jgi:glutamine amidotransferase
MITIVDYGVGNLASIKNMLKKVGVDALISSDAKDVGTAEKLILPGVGAFDTCAQKLKGSGLQDVLNTRAHQDKIPVLGICVGMQLLAEGSEEGKLPGLGWIKGRIVKFKKEQMPAELKIPHMGWSELTLNKPSRLFEGIDEPRYYFVHSYHMQPDHPEDAVVSASYGYSFTAGVEHNNILGVQFHPEKSHKFGMKLFENFVNHY